MKSIHKRLDDIEKRLPPRLDDKIREIVERHGIIVLECVMVYPDGICLEENERVELRKLNRKAFLKSMWDEI